MEISSEWYGQKSGPWMSDQAEVKNLTVSDAQNILTVVGMNIVHKQDQKRSHLWKENIYIYMYVYIYIYVCVYMCVYIYIYVCRHTYIHTYTHTIFCSDYIYLYNHYKVCVYICIHVYIHKQM